MIRNTSLTLGMEIVFPGGGGSGRSKGERLELHRRMAGVVETSWSLGDIDRATTLQREVHAARATAGRARLSAHGRARG